MKGNTICWTDIPVVDLDRAIKFYSAVLAAPVSKENEGGHEFGESRRWPNLAAQAPDWSLRLSRGRP
jgi:hypothetical protein